MPARKFIGVVAGDKTNKTRRGEIPRLVKTAKYGKIIKKRTICYAHDENNESHIGDTVEIQECRPLSKLKHFELVRIVAKSKMAGAADPVLADEGAAGVPVEKN
ncbi:MAG TPA: 30S ribosomal protein S17 [Pirellulales bacterium]